MIDKILFIVGISLIIFGYLYYFYIWFIERKNKNNITSLDLAVKVFNNNSINVVESNNSYFSKYNIKRKLVKISSDSYDKNDYFSLAVVALLSGFSKIESKFLEILGKVKSEISIIGFSPILVILISFFCSSQLDMKIGIFLVGLILVYQYVIDDSYGKIIDSFKSDDTKLINTMCKLRKVNTLFFLGGLVEVIRFIILII